MFCVVVDSEQVLQTLPVSVQDSFRTRLQSNAFELPVLPQAASQMMSLSEDASHDAKSIAEMIRSDQAMASHILRVANSPMYMTRAPIVTLQQAVSRLGIGTIRQIAMVVSCEARVFQVRGFENVVKAQFQHSLATGLFAQEIGRMKRLNVEEAFLCGLLHDVGRPILLQLLADVFHSAKEPLTLEQVTPVLDALHATVGANLLKEWLLSARVVETTQFHHQPHEAKTSSVLAHVTRLADDLAHIVLESDQECVLVTHASLTPLNLYPDELTQLLSRAEFVRSAVSSFV